jgi:hypothetical protein
MRGAVSESRTVGRVKRFAALGLLLSCATCGGGGRATSGSPTSSPTVSPSAASATGCEVEPAGPGGPVADPSGPYYHQVVVAATDDGRSLRDARQVLDHASVPDGVLAPDGSVLIYYVNGAQGGVWVARWRGGEVSTLGAISLDGVANPASIVDPDATRLSDGRIRLAYLSGFGAPGSTRARAMCLADSPDGIHFTVVGPALPLSSSETLTDPSLAPLGDGSWLMAISNGQRTLLARSSDGLRFERGETLAYGGVPELARTSDGGLRLYVCAAGIESYLSRDSGRSWTREGVVVASGTGGKRIICDPSLVAGAGLFVYKTAD